MSNIETRVAFGPYYNLVRVAPLLVSFATLLLGGLHVSYYWLALMAALHVVGYLLTRGSQLARAAIANNVTAKYYFLFFFGQYLVGAATQGVLYLIGYGSSLLFY